MSKVGLIGNPLSHSVSPAMQTAAFRAIGLDWNYLTLETQEADLPEVVEALRNPEWAGANVTVPYKEPIIELLDEIDDQAVAVGAVNTIVNDGAVLRGYNTDVQGFHNDVIEHGYDLAGAHAVVLGAGGGARAVVAALMQAGAKIELISRRPAQGNRLARSQSQSGGARITALEWTRDAFSSIGAGTLIVNTTPVGMWPHTEDSPWMEGAAWPEAGLVYDLVYNPPETRFMQQAARNGVPTRNGLGMLVEQGALAFEYWTGQTAPRRVMRSAAERVLVFGYA